MHCSGSTCLHHVQPKKHHSMFDPLLVYFALLVNRLLRTGRKSAIFPGINGSIGNSVSRVNESSSRRKARKDSLTRGKQKMLRIPVKESRISRRNDITVFHQHVPRHRL